MKPWLWRRIGWIDFPFVATTRFGHVIAGNTRDLVQSCIYYFGAWEPVLSEWIQASLKNRDVFIDCGANVGYFSLLASKYVGSEGEVIAVEASPSVFRMLSDNIRRNDARNISLRHAALGSQSGEVFTYLAPGGAVGLTTTVPREGFIREESVSMITLSSLITDETRSRVRFIKIDVEGAEAEVIHGLGPLERLTNPKLEICVEVTPQAAEIVDRMRESGFTAYVIPNEYGNAERYLRRGRPEALARFTGSVDCQVDLLFSRRSELELRPWIE